MEDYTSVDESTRVVASDIVSPGIVKMLKTLSDDDEDSDSLADNPEN